MPSHRKQRDAQRAERRNERDAQRTTPRGARRPDPAPLLQADERQPFTCGHCGLRVDLTVSGGHNRNHCPYCLYSLHVDDRRMGDRASACGGLMEPIARFTRPKGEEVIVHRCVRCGMERHNRVAADDTIPSVRALPEVESRQTRRGEPAIALASGVAPERE